MASTSTTVVVALIYAGTVVLYVGTTALIVRAWTRRRNWHGSPSDLHYIAVSAALLVSAGIAIVVASLIVTALGYSRCLERDKGTPQGGVVSPLLANLFLHYAFDLWVTRHLPGIRFARYADDAVLHCKSKRQAEYVLDRIRERFRACKLELHPGKTRIVYCKDINRTSDHPDIQFTFLGYTFRPRKALDKYGRVYVNFSPAVSRDALKAMRQTIRGWHLQLKSDKSLADLSAMFAPILKGWQQYYGRFHGSALKPVWRSMNLFLIRWLMRKHKRLAGRKTRAAEMLKRLAQSQPGAFIHWSLGILS